MEPTSKDGKRMALQQAMVNGISQPLPSTEYRAAWNCSHTYTHTLRFISTDSLSNANIYKPLFVIYCQYNCKTGVLLYNVKCGTFHLKVVADCSFIIHSYRFTVQSTDVALKSSHTVCCTVQVTQGAALDEVVKEM